MTKRLSAIQTLHYISMTVCRRAQLEAVRLQVDPYPQWWWSESRQPHASGRAVVIPVTEETIYGMTAAMNELDELAEDWRNPCRSIQVARSMILQARLETQFTQLIEQAGAEWGRTRQIEIAARERHEPVGD